MKAAVIRTSQLFRRDGMKVIEINSLEELINMCREEEECLIISLGYRGKPEGGADFEIEIYDDYRE